MAHGADRTRVKRQRLQGVMALRVILFAAVMFSGVTDSLLVDKTRHCDQLVIHSQSNGETAMNLHVHAIHSSTTVATAIENPNAGIDLQSITIMEDYSSMTLFNDVLSTNFINPADHPVSAIIASYFARHRVRYGAICALPTAGSCTRSQAGIFSCLPHYCRGADYCRNIGIYSCTTSGQHRNSTGCGKVQARTRGVRKVRRIPTAIGGWNVVRWSECPSCIDRSEIGSLLSIQRGKLFVGLGNCRSSSIVCNRNALRVSPFKLSFYKHWRWWSCRLAFMTLISRKNLKQRRLRVWLVVDHFRTLILQIERN